MPLRRESALRSPAGFVDDAGADADDGAAEFGRRRAAVRVSFRAGLVPATLWGKIAAGCGAAVVLGGAVAGALAVRHVALHDEHFVVENTSGIEIAGNSRLTRPQLLSVFGEDVERNIFGVPLADRRAQLESLPWVAHATVMRLLPNRVRVAIVERTPVAFVREGSEIGLVDAHGVLLDMADGGGPGAKADYSFPVLTGISAKDPLSTRAARMRIYLDFVAALDAGGEKISARLSEVDVSNPEDVRAILPDGTGAMDVAGGSDAAGGAGVLVHFGEEKYLERYKAYEQHLAEWKTQYPKLASVDMRYERQVVLEMKDAGGVDAAGKTRSEPTSQSRDPSAGSGQGVGHPHPVLVEKKAAPVVAKAKPVSVAAARPVSTAKPLVPLAGAAPAVPGRVGVTATAAKADGIRPVQHLTTAFDVHTDKAGHAVVGSPAPAGAPAAGGAPAAVGGTPR